jgi:hypothetical protein
MLVLSTSVHTGSAGQIDCGRSMKLTIHLHLTQGLVSRLYRQHDWWMMKWKGFGRERWRHNRSIIPKIAENSSQNSGCGEYESGATPLC